jgi:hypothetical protein
MRLRNVLVLLLIAGCLGPPESALAQPYSPPQQASATYWTPPEPSAQPVDYDEPGYATINVRVTGESVRSIDVFFDQLDPYGTWYDDPTYGWVFAPSQSGYVPYSNGRWKYTDYGMLWVSNDRFGWATDHYGRWVYQNRWVWAPDLTWGPAWVSWRQGNGWIGWAPSGHTAHAYVPDEHWRFVAAPHLFSFDIRSHYEASNIHLYLNTTMPIVRYHRHDNNVWVAGPSENWMRHHRLDVRRERVNASELGRLDTQRRAEAERHARARQHEWDQRRPRAVQVRRDLDQRVREQREEQSRLVEGQRRLAEQRRTQAAERSWLEDQQRKNQDARTRARSDAERQRVEDDQRKLAEHKNRVEDSQRQAQQEQIARQQEDQRRREDGAKRQRADQDRASSEQQQRFDEQKRKADVDENRRSAAIEQRKQQNDAKRNAADDQKRAAADRKKAELDKRNPDERRREHRRP